MAKKIQTGLTLPKGQVRNAIKAVVTMRVSSMALTKFVQEGETMIKKLTAQADSMKGLDVKTIKIKHLKAGIDKIEYPFISGQTVAKFGSARLQASAGFYANSIRTVMKATKGLRAERISKDVVNAIGGHLRNFIQGLAVSCAEINNLFKKKTLSEELVGQILKICKTSMLD